VDVLCLQEVRALEEQLPTSMSRLPGYHSYFLAAQKKGYSGVAIYAKQPPNEVISGMGDALLDGEGRLLCAKWDRLWISSLYAPSGSSGEERQAVKDRFMDHMIPYFQNMSGHGIAQILCGDINIAHREIDIKNWRSNQTNSGFLPHERKWLDRLFDEFGIVDAFRTVDQRAEQYTWWSNRGQARAKNVGWRIDYQLVTPNLQAKIRRAEISPEPFFSDHAPLTVDYDCTLL
jgi:exodeoxyribonuclease-3